MHFPLRWLLITTGWLVLVLLSACVEIPINSFTYSANPAVYTKGVAITPNTPSSTGATAYSVAPGLPSGLALNTTTGVITGTPTVAGPATTYVVTAAISSGNRTCSLKITVNDVSALAILVQPGNQLVQVGQTALFSVSAVGPGTLSYQWAKNGTAISGATSASYTTPATLLTDSGSTFTVSVRDSTGGSLTSNAATLTVVTTLPGTWTATTGNLVTGRAFHTATWLPPTTSWPSGQVLLAGGFNGASLNVAERYDPVADTFTATAGNMAEARDSHTETRLQDGKVLLIGGSHNGSSTSSAELYDPATDTFSPTTGSLNSPRASHTATLLPSGKVLVVGGRSGSAYSLTAELYDPTTGRFTYTGSLHGARATHTATLLSTGKVLIAGGFNGSNLASAELYDPVAGTFTTTTSMASARAYHTATELANGLVLVVGGTTAAELYDPATEQFTTTGSPVVARDHWHAAVRLQNGKVLIAGGMSSGSTVLASAELYDPAAGTFTATGSLASARRVHTATLLASTGKVLVAGGSGSSGYPVDGEVYQ